MGQGGGEGGSEAPSNISIGACQKRVWFQPLPPPRDAADDVSRTHGNFPKQRQVCAVGVVAGGKGWVVVVAAAKEEEEKGREEAVGLKRTHTLFFSWGEPGPLSLNH